MYFTVLPLLVAFMAGLLSLAPTNVVQVCYGEMGIEHAQPWRARALSAVATRGRAFVSSASEMFRAWRAHPFALPAATAAGVMAIHFIAPDMLHGLQFAVIAGTLNIKQIRQDIADTDRAIASKKAEARALMLIEKDKRAADHEVKLTALEADVDALTVKASELATDHSRALKFQNEERAQGTPPVVTFGDNREALAPWGPQAPANASVMVQNEVRHLALGNFAQAVRMAALGQGMADPRLQAAATGAGTQSDSNLGFAVPHDVAPGIEREMYEQGEILSRVDGRPITGNAITYNVVDETSRADSSRGGGVLGYWVDEGTAPTASNTKLARIEMKLRKVGAFGVMTDELLSDALALGGELESAFAVELIFQTENKAYRGNGNSAPLGFLNAPCLVSVSKETNQAAATINTTNLSKMWARMPSRSKKKSVWMINTDCNPQLDELAQAIGTGGSAPRFVTYNNEGVLLIKGRPVIEVEYAETVGTVGDIALIDWARYRMIRKGGIEQASSMHVYFSTGEQAFRAFYRVDGQPVPRAAITPFKGSNTLSPFVVLATRS